MHLCKKCGKEMSKWGKQAKNGKPRYHCKYCAAKRRLGEEIGFIWTRRMQVICALFTLGFWVCLIARWLNISHTAVGKIVKPFAGVKTKENRRQLPIVVKVYAFPAAPAQIGFNDIGKNGSILLDLDGELDDILFVKAKLKAESKYKKVNYYGNNFPGQ